MGSDATLPLGPPPDRRSSEVQATVVRDGSSSHGTEPASTGATKSLPPAAPFGRYVLIAELGRGGMGCVWKAWDTQLQRTVALKQILGGGNARQVERFMREAQTAARLRHPNIVAVHDVGVQDGQHYFTSDYVEGTSLEGAMARGLPARQALELVRAIGEALSYAHAQGVVHRDVKPANVLIDASGRPFVTDFGLAKEVDRTSALTVTGDLLGTPAYMSPEQASGRVSLQGPASDQFSLGVVLYELLTGHLPFEGDSLQALLNAITDREPPPPTRWTPRLHPDVETVCMKALEKAPEKRYATIAEFAADIGRYLNAEPIAARHVSWAERIVRRAVRHRRVVLPTALALLSASALVGWLAVSRALDAREVRVSLALARRCRQESRPRDARDMYQRARTLDPGNREADDGFAWAEAEQVRLDAAAEDERRRLAADAEAARRDVEASEAISRVFGRWAMLREPLRELEGVAYGDAPAEEKLARTDSLWSEHFSQFLAATPDEPGARAAAKALAGWARALAGHRDEGLRWMDEATKSEPDGPYGALMAALLLFSDYAGAERLPSIARGASGFHFGPAPPESSRQAELRTRIEELLVAVGGARLWGRGMEEEMRAALEGIRASQRGELESAETHLSRALTAPDLAPFVAGLQLARSHVRYRLQRFDLALRDIEAVLEVRPHFRPLFLYRGLIQIGRGVVLESRGQDGRPCLREAIVSFDESVSMSAQDVDSFLCRSVATVTLAMAERARGVDEAALLERAMADCTAAIGLEPDSPCAWNDRGTVRMAIGCWETEHGKDARRRAVEAIEDFSRALALDPGSAVYLHNRADGYCTLGDLETRAGADGVPWLEKSVADMDEVVRQMPSSDEVLVARGGILTSMAMLLLVQQRDPRAALDRAFADLDEAIRRAPDNHVAWSCRGNAWRHRGNAEGSVAGDPRASFRRAVEDVTEALRLNPLAPGARQERAAAWLALAQAEAARGVDGREALAKALEDLDAALEMAPTSVPTLLQRAGVRLQLAAELNRLGEGACEAMESAVADYEAAIQAGADTQVTRMDRGRAYMGLGQLRARAGEDASDAYGRAMADFEAAIAKDGRFGPAFTNKGLLHILRGETEEAVKAFERALELAGGRDAQLEDWLAKARARLGK